MFTTPFSLASLNGSNGFILNGIDEVDLSGSSVSGAGDVNGDGIDDIIIGAFLADPNGNVYAGESYVVFGIDREPIVTTEADEFLTGTIEDDIIYGFDGSDTINGLAGDDNINGGSGNDLITAGEGDDLVLGNSGDDTIFGNKGDDRIRGGRNNDLLYGGAGDDLLRGSSGNDTIFGNKGDDRIRGGRNNDLLYGGVGKDFLRGNLGDDTIFGNKGDDRIRGGRNNDLLYGGVGNDLLRGNSGNDTIFGNGGDDRIRGGSRDDLIEGGSGNDRITGGRGNDTLIGVDLTSADSALGRGEKDTLIANRRNNSQGNDTFILGNENGVFYNDGNSNTAGEADVARILGFSSSNDTIQLSGSAELYDLEFVTLPTGTTNASLVYNPESEVVGESIAHLIDVSPDLSLDDSAFVFV